MSSARYALSPFPQQRVKSPANIPSSFEHPGAVRRVTMRDDYTHKTSSNEALANRKPTPFQQAPPTPPKSRDGIIEYRDSYGNHVQEADDDLMERNLGLHNLPEDYKNFGDEGRSHASGEEVFVRDPARAYKPSVITRRRSNGDYVEEAVDDNNEIRTHTLEDIQDFRPGNLSRSATYAHPPPPGHYVEEELYSDPEDERSGPRMFTGKDAEGNMFSQADGGNRIRTFYKENEHVKRTNTFR